MSDPIIKLLVYNEEKIVVSSRQIVAAFEKQHRYVLRVIESLKKIV